MSLEFWIRGADDERVETLAHHAVLRAYDERPRQSLGDCPICGIVETLLVGDRCHQCEDARRWSQSNKLFCDLLHRPPP